jgi:hypothetical protein
MSSNYTKMYLCDQYIALIPSCVKVAACWMSYRYFLASSRIEQRLGLIDGLPEIGVLDG